MSESCKTVKAAAIADPRWAKPRRRLGVRASSTRAEGVLSASEPSPRSPVPMRAQRAAPALA